MFSQQQQTYFQIYKALGGTVTADGHCPSDQVLKTLLYLAKDEPREAHESFQKRSFPQWPIADLVEAMAEIQQSKLCRLESSLYQDLEKQISWFEQMKPNVQERIESVTEEQRRLAEELTNLKQHDLNLNSEFAVLSQRIEKHRILCDEFSETNLEMIAAKEPGSPRSLNAVSKLSEVESQIGSLERELFSLVPLTNRLETKTRLAVMVGEIEKMQDKHVDAIQSLGLTAQSLIATRRRALVKRLVILATLARTLHDVSSNSAESLRG